MFHALTLSDNAAWTKYVVWS